MHRTCADAGGAPEDCLAEARASVETCIQETCDAAGEPPPPPPAPPSRGDGAGEPPPPPPACAQEALDACRQVGANAGRACAEAGGDRPTCGQAAAEAGRACVAEQCLAP